MKVESAHIHKARLHRKIVDELRGAALVSGTWAGRVHRVAGRTRQTVEKIIRTCNIRASLPVIRIEAVEKGVALSVDVGLKTDVVRGIQSDSRTRVTFRRRQRPTSRIPIPLPSQASVIDRVVKELYPAAASVCGPHTYPDDIVVSRLAAQFTVPNRAVLPGYSRSYALFNVGIVVDKIVHRVVVFWTPPCRVAVSGAI